MYDLLESLKKATQEIVDNINKVDYEELQSFVLFREDIVRQLQQRSSDVRERVHLQPMVRDILANDAAVLERMEQLKNEATQKLVRLQASKSQKNVYEGSSTYVQSVFFDRKK